MLELEESTSPHPVTEYGRGRILFLDRDPARRERRAQPFAAAGWEVGFADDEASAFASIWRRRPELMVVDLESVAARATDLVRRLRGLDDDMWIVLLSGEATVAHAVEAMKEGASDFLLKPFAPSRLLEAVQELAQAPREVVTGGTQVSRLTAV